MESKASLPFTNPHIRFFPRNSIVLDREPILIDSAFAPNEVLANLRARASEWRESSIPNDVRVGVTGLALTVSGNDFTLRWAGQVSPLFNPIGFGTIAPVGDGSRISIRFELRPRNVLKRIDRIFAIALALTLLVMGGGRWSTLFATGVIVTIWLSGRGKTDAFRYHLLRIVTEAAKQMPTANPAFTRPVPTNGP